MVRPPNRLRKNRRDVENLHLRAETAVLVLWHRVGHDHLVDGRGVDAGDGVAAQYGVGEEGVDLEGALLLEELGGAGNCVGRVDEVVDEDADLVADVADEHHGGVAVLGELGGPAFLEGVC